MKPAPGTSTRTLALTAIAIHVGMQPDTADGLDDSTALTESHHASVASCSVLASRRCSSGVPSSSITPWSTSRRTAAAHFVSLNSRASLVALVCASSASTIAACAWR